MTDRIYELIGTTLCWLSLAVLVYAACVAF